MKNPITYTGSSTNNLYVLALKDGKEVKIKVKDLNCCGPIKVDEIVKDAVSYHTLNELLKAQENGELVNGTIYIVEGKEYLYYQNVLNSLDRGTVSGLVFGSSYETFELLDEARKKGDLFPNTIYTVLDKGSIEQYILQDNKAIQISGQFNNIVEGSSEDEKKDDVSPLEQVNSIDYNLEELVNGNYRYKNHSELTSVISDMPALQSAIQMFWGCPLTYFCGNLDSLEEAYGMFFGSKLDEDSIINIVDGIKNHGADAEKRSIIIGYNSSVSEAFLQNISQEFSSKGWEVQWHKNGEVLPLKTF